MIAESILGVGPAQAASVQDATAEHLIEAFEELPKQDQILMVKKLLNGALREDEVMTKVEEAMVLERAPEVRIAKNETKKDFDAPSTSATTMNEKEILERAVQEMPNASPEQRAKAAEILRRLEEETGKVRGEKEEESASTKNASYDASNSGSSSRLENNRFNDFEKEEPEEKDDNPFEDEDIVWDLRSAVASLTTVAKAKLIPPLAFGTGFAALAFVLTKMVGGDDAGNETRDEARMNDESDARISPPPPPPPPSTIMNDRNDNDAGDIAPPLLPMEEAKRLLFESQAIQPPPVSTTTSKTKKMKKSENRGRGVATNTTSSGGNSNSVLWKRKEEKYDALLEAAVEEEDEDIEDPFEDDDDEPERGEEAREMSPPPRKSAASGSTSGGVKKQRRPPPDLTSASFLSEEDREKNFENIRARRPR